MNSSEEVTDATQEPQGKTTGRKLPLYALFIAYTVSYVGDALMLLALPWFVLQTTGSVAKMGITAFFETLPTVLAAFFGSALVDRLGYKRTSVVSDVLSTVGVGLIPLLYHIIGLAFWQFLVLVFFSGLLTTPGRTARSSMLPDLAEAAKMPLERANAITDGTSRVSGFIGAPLAAILIAIIGSSNLLFIDAATFAFSALLIGIVVPYTAPIPQKDDTLRGYVASLRQGIHFITHDPLILAIVATVLITNLLDISISAVIAPAWIKHIFGSPLPLGIIFAAHGGAAFIGTLIFGAIGHRLPRRLTFGIGFILAGVFYSWTLLIPILPVMVVGQIISGLGASPLNPLIDTIAQERIPTDMRARVFGTITAGVYIGIPIGAFVSGYVVTWVGLQASIIAIGILYLLTTLSLLVNPALKRMDVKAKSI